MENNMKTKYLISLTCLLITIFNTLSCGLMPLDEAEYLNDKYGITKNDIYSKNSILVYSATPTINFKNVKDAASYDLEISKNSNFSSLLISENLKPENLNYTLTKSLPEMGAYYCRIKVNFTEGKSSSWFNYDLVYLGFEAFDSFEIVDDEFSTLHSWNTSYQNKPTIQSHTFYDGKNAVEISSNYTYTDGYFELRKYFEKDSIISFYIKNDAGNFNFSIQDSSVISINEITSTWTKHTVFVESGSKKLTWAYSSSYSSNSAYIDCIEIADSPELKSAFDSFINNSITIDSISTSSYYKPFIQTDSVDGKEGSIQFGNINSHGPSSFEISANFEKDTLITFYALNNSSEDMTVSINSRTVTTIPDTISEWTKYSFYVEPGYKTIKWDRPYYYSNNDTVYISDIEVTNLPDFESFFSNFDVNNVTLISTTRGGDSKPYIQSTVFNSGDSSIQFGDIKGYEDSHFQINVDIKKHSTLSFNTQYQGSGNLKLYINTSSGKLLRESTEENIWIPYKETLSPGSYTIKLEYDKRSYINGKAWADDIKIVEIPIQSGLNENFESGSLPGYISGLWDIDNSGAEGAGFSLKSNTVSSSEETTATILVNITKPSILSYDCKLSSFDNYDYLRFYINNENKYSTKISGSWDKKSFILEPGQHILKWTFDQGNYTTGTTRGAWIDNLLIETIETQSSINEDFETGLVPEYIEGDWIIDSTNGADISTYSLKSKDINSGEETSFSIKVYITSNKTLSFDRKVSSEYHLDDLVFYINDIRRNSWSGEKDWAKENPYNLLPGYYELKWTYSKSSYSSSTIANGWIDNIVLQ